MLLTRTEVRVRPFKIEQDAYIHVNTIPSREESEIERERDRDISLLARFNGVHGVADSSHDHTTCNRAYMCTYVCACISICKIQEDV